MSLSCECDDGVAEFVTIAWHKARKEYRCIECRQVIPVGTVYERQSGKFEGHMFCYKTCERCADLHDALSDLGYCMQTGNLIDDYQDYLQMIGSHKTVDDIFTPRARSNHD